MALKLNKIFFILDITFIIWRGYSQENDGPKPPKVKIIKTILHLIDFNKLRFKVAKAQINLLKNEGALLVRLKTNANTINRLKKAGNIDLATQVERETQLNNKIIISSIHQRI
jgi:hypothetical protein